MNDEQAFLTAIALNPDDDTTRLVYADWLEEHGKPERAEFIRAQIELARIKLRPELFGTLLLRASDRAIVLVSKATLLPMMIIVDLHCGDALGREWRLFGCTMKAFRTSGHRADMWECEFSVSGAEDPNKERKRKLEDRERDLFTAHAIRWLSGYPQIEEAPALHLNCLVRCGIGPHAERVREYRFVRGFPNPFFPTAPLPSTL